MINFVSDLRPVGGFLRFLPPIKLTTARDITELLLKVALNTIKQTKPISSLKFPSMDGSFTGQYVITVRIFLLQKEECTTTLIDF